MIVPAPRSRSVPRLALPLLFAALVVFAVPARGQILDARGYDEDFVFGLASSGISSAYLLCDDSAGPRPALSDPFLEMAISEEEVGPTTDVDLTLQYDTSGGPFSTTRTVQVDNTTHLITLAGNPVSTLFDIFGPTPPPISPTAVLLCHARHWVILLLRAIQAIILSGDVYITDQGQYVPTSGPGSGKNVTAPMEAGALAAWGYVVGNDPNAANTIVRVQPPSPDYDCHGFTFTKKFRWINDFEWNGANKGFQTVQKILDDNGYTEVAANQVQAGDIAVYRNTHPDLHVEKITHTGKVTAVKDNGTIIVESKWGSMSRFVHEASRVPPGYGTPPKYYRTNRGGNNGNQHFLNIGTPGPQPTPVRPTISTWGQIKNLYR